MRKTKKTKVSKNLFPQSVNLETQKAISRNLSEVSEVLSMKVRTLFDQGPKKEKAQISCEEIFEMFLWTYEMQFWQWCQNFSNYKQIRFAQNPTKTESIEFVYQKDFFAPWRSSEHIEPVLTIVRKHFRWNPRKNLLKVRKKETVTLFKKFFGTFFWTGWIQFRQHWRTFFARNRKTKKTLTLFHILTLLELITWTCKTQLWQPCCKNSIRWPVNIPTNS